MAGPEEPVVPAERLAEQVRVCWPPPDLRARDVVAQRRRKVGCAQFSMITFARCLGRAAQIGQALLGDDDLHVVLGVVDVRAPSARSTEMAPPLAVDGRHEDREVARCGRSRPSRRCRS